MAIKIGIVGVGKIARDQHLPVIAASSQFELIAAASRNARVEGVRNFTSLAAMLDGAPDIEAVALCTPPLGRAADARIALERGVHVLLEKPPGATLSEVHALADLAEKRNLTLFASWHSRFAPAVESARAWLAGRAVRRVQIKWKEDIRVWHPGQDWILAPGGLGVFDPGINALSIATHILPAPFALRSARLAFPENRQAPIAAELHFVGVDGATINAEFDFLQTGAQTWDIDVATDTGSLKLSKGGALMSVDGAAGQGAAGADLLHAEYTPLYEHFAALIAAQRSDVDLAPLRHVADAFMLGDRRTAPAFEF